MASDLHREKVSRFWTLYVQGQGGRLGTFTGDLPIAFAALREPLPPANATSLPPRSIAVTPLDPAHSRVEMLRVTRDVGTTDWIAQDSLRHPALHPPSQTCGPMKIGIRWKGDLDLDLYASPGPHQERLSFEHPKTPEGYYFKDHRSSPDREYEFIEFLEPVDLHQVRASINFYQGEIHGGPVGEVRVEFEGRIYSAPFAIEATQGNQGREGDRHARFWTTLDLPALLKVR